MTTKRVLKIEGYTVYPTSDARYKNILVLSNDNTVVEFEDMDVAQYPVLIRALEADESVIAYVIADNHGAYVYDEDGINLIREGEE